MGGDFFFLPVYISLLLYFPFGVGGWLSYFFFISIFCFRVYEVDVTDIARESMWEAMSREGAEGKSAWLKIWTLDIRDGNFNRELSL